MPRWPLEKSPQPLSGLSFRLRIFFQGRHGSNEGYNLVARANTLHCKLDNITGREGVALQGPRQGVALAPEKNDVTRFHIVLSGAHFSSGAKVLCDKGRHCVQQVSVSPTRGRGLSNGFVTFRRIAGFGCRDGGEPETIFGEEREGLGDVQDLGTRVSQPSGEIEPHSAIFPAPRSANR